jgi:hypothetical protein
LSHDRLEEVLTSVLDRRKERAERRRERIPELNKRAAETLLRSGLAGEWERHQDDIAEFKAASWASSSRLLQILANTAALVAAATRASDLVRVTR